mmetsp:Transcript_87564/g.175175  ORF Transcript_87564/g.175175 Transcript_87564/m.175175 type:complete len:231 (+) Transcript_87564:627-1319(+)
MGDLRPVPVALSLPRCGECKPSPLPRPRALHQPCRPHGGGLDLLVFGPARLARLQQRPAAAAKGVAFARARSGSLRGWFGAPPRTRRDRAHPPRRRTRVLRKGHGTPCGVLLLWSRRRPLGRPPSAQHAHAPVPRSVHLGQSAGHRGHARVHATPWRVLGGRLPSAAAPRLARGVGARSVPQVRARGVLRGPVDLAGQPARGHPRPSGALFGGAQRGIASAQQQRGERRG